MFCTRRLTALSLALSTVLVAGEVDAVAPTGGFFVHINQNQNFSDSRRSVTYYSDADMTDALFSVHIPGEVRGDLNYNYEELDAIAVDPATGDTYVLSYDSDPPGTLEDDGQGGFDNTGDADIYRIDFQAAYDHWSSTFMGKVAAGMTGVGGPAPYVPAGVSAGARDDYVTYGIGPLFDGVFNNNGGEHSNVFALDGVVAKIAEVKRNEGSDFFDRSLEFVDSNTLLLLDDSSVPNASESAATDHAYRLIERVSTSPGAADDSTADDGDGGYNNGTTESWNSRIIGRVNLDFAGGEPTGHSEPESIAYYQDALTGARGVWVTESDGGGDDIAFFDIDLQAYREHAVGGGPDFPTSFALDNDPFTDSSTNDGKADHIFVDSDTGDIIIVESGFGDFNDVIGDDHEPAVIRREVLSYDDGAGRIQFGAWSEKVISTPTKDPGDTFLERGHWAAYDSENDLVYFINAGGGGETPSFEADIMVLDVNTGVTSNYMNVDDSVSLFFQDSFGDVADFFFLEGEAGGLAGDFNSDGLVDAADYTVWRDNLGAADESALGGNGDGLNGVDSADYEVWRANFGASSAGVGASAAPEPAALLLAVIGSIAAVRRRR